MATEERDIQRKLRVLQLAEKTGNVRKTCRYFGVGWSRFYRWRDSYQKHGEAGLKNAKSIPKNPANQTPAEIVEKFPFRIRAIRADNGHEIQAKFHWHIEDKGIPHAYIKRSTPQLNGKVERSHRSDQQEFYQLLSYKGDVDLEAKLDEWQRFYNFARPHGAHKGRPPYDAL